MNRQIEYWKVSAEHDWETAQALFKSKRYDACLFFCHLTIEKLLKGLVTEKTHKPAPYIHDLSKLAELAGLHPTPDQLESLKMITTFNISARYDSVKLSFYKICTPAFTRKYYAISKELNLWLKKEFPKK